MRKASARDNVQWRGRRRAASLRRPHMSDRQVAPDTCARLQERDNAAQWPSGAAAALPPPGTATRQLRCVLRPAGASQAGAFNLGSYYYS